MPELTPKQKKLAEDLTLYQRRLVLEIVSGKKMAEAHMAAGGKAKGKQVAESSAVRTLKNPKVKAFYESLMEQVAERVVMDRAEALQILTDIARVKITDVVEFGTLKVGEDADGNPIEQAVWKFKDGAELDDATARAISEVATGKDGLKLKLHAQTGAIDQLAKILGWNAPTKTELSGPEGAPLRVDVDLKAPEIVAALDNLLSKL